MDNRSINSRSCCGQQRPTRMMDLEAQARMSELRSIRLSVERTRFRMEGMLSDIDNEIEKLLKKIEGLLNNYDSDTRQGNCRPEVLSNAVYSSPSHKITNEIDQNHGAVLGGI